ncbi:MAG TPA: OsmC family protein [Bauldia sp.]|nr:OsmC family protein [Bauldia sp.]
MNDIRQSVEAAIAYLRSHPAEARYTDSRATATLEKGLRFRVKGPGGESILTDMPKGIGGDGEAPSPGWLFRAALAACDASLIAIEAARENIDLARLEVAVESQSDDRGILAMDPSIPAGPLSIQVRVILQGNAGGDRLRDLAQRALGHCPVHEAAGRPVPVTVTVETG